MPRILSISYDNVLLDTRKLMLERSGYEVVSAWGLVESLKKCKQGSGFDVFVLGHSVPNSDKEALITEFRKHCAAPTISVRRAGELDACGADYEIEPDSRHLLALIAKIFRGGTAVV